MHAIVVRETAEGPMLVAGERRFRAMEELHLLGRAFQYDSLYVKEGCVPTVSLGELSALEAEEAELDENLKRKDLTWQEHAAAVERLHHLRNEQRQKAFEEAAEAGEVHGDASAVAEQYPKQSVADTALELHGRSDGSFQDKVRKELIVARHLDNPAVAKAKSVDEAFKVLKAQEQTAKNVALAAKVGASFTADKHVLLNQSCLQFMRRTDKRFDVICTDPPYGMGADDFGDGAGKLAQIEHHYDDSYEAWVPLLQEFCTLSYQVAKPQAHAYIFCDFDRFHELKKWMQAAGWYVFRTPIINHKINSGRVPLPDQGPRRQYEIILYAIKGKKPVTHIYPDVLSCPADESMGHGAQKPVAVFTNLLMRSIRPGDEVFDGFAGTGPVFAAGHTLLCQVTGCEIEPEYYALALKRIQGLKALELPGLL